MKIKKSKIALAILSVGMLFSAMTVNAVTGITGNNSQVVAHAETNSIEVETFTSLEASLNEYVSYAAAKGSASTDPALINGEIRVYQNGGLFTVFAKSDATISEIVIGSSMATSVTYSIDDGTDSDKAAITAGNTIKISNISASNSVVFTCTGTSRNARLYVNYLKVTYVAPDPKQNAIDTFTNLDTHSKLSFGYTKGYNTIKKTNQQFTPDVAELSHADVFTSYDFDGIIISCAKATGTIDPRYYTHIAKTGDGIPAIRAYVSNTISFKNTSKIDKIVLHTGGDGKITDASNLSSSDIDSTKTTVDTSGTITLYPTGNEVTLKAISKTFISQIDFDYTGIDKDSVTYSNFNNAQLQFTCSLTDVNTSLIDETGIYATTSVFDFKNDGSITSLENSDSSHKFVNSERSKDYVAGISIDSTNEDYVIQDFYVAAYIKVDNKFYFAKSTKQSLIDILDAYKSEESLSTEQKIIVTQFYDQVNV